MHDTVFFDVDTQEDFLLPVGALYVPGAEHLIPTLATLFAAARERGIPVISTVDAHSERDPEFAQWPPHCIAGTLGQAKIPETLLPGQQVIVEKQTVRVFDAPGIDAVLAAHPARRYVVFGVVTEICVWYAVEGLLKRGHNVAVVTDAIASLDSALDPAGKGSDALRAMTAAGAQLIAASDA